MITPTQSFSIQAAEPLLPSDNEPKPRGCLDRVLARIKSIYQSKKFGGVLTVGSAAGMISGNQIAIIALSPILGFGVQHLCLLRYPKGIEAAITIEPPPDPNRSCFSRLFDKSTEWVLRVQKYYSHPLSRVATMISPISVTAKFSIILGFAGMFGRTLLQRIKSENVKKDPEKTLEEITLKTLLTDAFIISVGCVGKFLIPKAIPSEITQQIVEDLSVALASRPLGSNLLKMLHMQNKNADPSKMISKANTFAQALLINSTVLISSGFILRTYASRTLGMIVIGTADGCKNLIYNLHEMKKIIPEDIGELNTKCQKVWYVFRDNFFTVALYIFAIQDIINPNRNTSLPYQGAIVIFPGILIYYWRRIIRLVDEDPEDKCIKAFKKLLIDIPDKYLQEGIWYSLVLAEYDPKDATIAKVISLILTGFSIGVSQELLRQHTVNKATPSFVRWGALTDFPVLLK